ncbi:Kinesin light chain 1 [Geodia barretti]|uniref:Kinesin light chain n=1 Tax=Geodia barretti TaxID=519541 RepID=A0AA35WYE4_GEOBA|nr:Kinesin light chain 1 [Geodia barretti]
MDSSASSESTVTADLGALLESTMTLSRGLETLYSEHEVLLEALGASGETSKTSLDSSTVESEKSWGDADVPEDFGLQVKAEKTNALSHSLNLLRAGMSEAKLLHMMAQYVNTLEGDKKTLRAQVKRLASENNWLRKELAEHQQLLQETEIQLARVREEKEQLEFTLSNQKDERGAREQSPSMDIDVQEEEAEGVHSRSSGSLGGGGVGTSSSARSDYEGKPEIAVPFCKKAVLELKQKKGSEDPDVAAMLNILAVIYREQGKMKEAIKCLHETLDIREKHFGLGHPAVAATTTTSVSSTGRLETSRLPNPTARKPWRSGKRCAYCLLGATHPDVAKQFSNLAILCQHLGKYDEVEYYYQRALEIYQTELGPDDPNIAKTLNHLANCYLKQGKYRAAEATYKKVLDSVDTREAPGSGGVPGQSPVHSTAWVLKRLLREHQHHHQVNSTLRNLSNLYREQGQLDKAEELDRLTQQKTLDKSQQDRVFELLSEVESSAEGSLSSATQPTKSQQAFRGKRPSLSQSVRRLFRLKVDPEEPVPPPDSHSQ